MKRSGEQSRGERPLGERLPVERLMSIAREAGREILKVYETDFSVEYKQDRSPLTEADRASHRVIAAGLGELFPGIPVVSEEADEQPPEQPPEQPTEPSAERTPGKAERLWLVDPLDGTKEFVKRNGEFTVNIALVEHGYPVFGLIYAPCLDVLYYGGGREAYRVEGSGPPRPIRASQPQDAFIVAESRSHPSEELDRFLEGLSARYGRIERIRRGSSLKFCAVAEGSAHLYARYGPTMEWDTAAGQAIVEAAGGAVIGLDGKRLAYNKPGRRNGFFLAASVELPLRT